MIQLTSTSEKLTTMSTARGNKEAEKANQELIASLKLKVKELEQEVSTLKGRLDDLRKAKNTTITKRERELVEVGFKRDPRYEAKIAELERQMKEKLASKDKEIEELKRRHAEELAAQTKKQKDLQKQIDDLMERLDRERKDWTDKLNKQKNTPSCNHDDEISKLKAKNTELEGDKSALMVENKDLKDRVNALHLELSVKEAKWCEKEEQYNLKLKQQYGDKYAEWMAETERKINELQETNQLLRMYLHRSGQRLPPEAGGGV
ncbi:synaptonemal complex protein 1-like [Ruditapes philippinarum]|uniref:synaptonemal complex protein 1-like n=1 Tax=Ruditapes philippinarum TaxID=129788 RepID=UPI00295A7CEE|nr:synaptonemal complex protein 1-like [Ruditapes philippinarum]